MNSPVVSRFLSVGIARITGWGLALIVVIFTIVPPFMRPETGAPRNFEHLAVFLLTGAAFGIGYSRRGYILCILAILFSAIVELLQLFVQGRHARFSDFVVDALGGGMGVLAGALFVAWRTAYWKSNAPKKLKPGSIAPDF